MSIFDFVEVMFELKKSITLNRLYGEYISECGNNASFYYNLIIDQRDSAVERVLKLNQFELHLQSQTVSKILITIFLVID